MLSATTRFRLPRPRLQVEGGLAGRVEPFDTGPIKGQNGLAQTPMPRAGGAESDLPLREAIHSKKQEHRPQVLKNLTAILVNLFNLGTAQGLIKQADFIQSPLKIRTVVAGSDDPEHLQSCIKLAGIVQGINGFTINIQGLKEIGFDHCKMMPFAVEEIASQILSTTGRIIGKAVQKAQLTVFLHHLKTGQARLGT